MRCFIVRDTDLDRECLGTATHLMLYSTRDAEARNREHRRDPVCEPCGRAYEQRPALKARIVPLHIYTPTPELNDIAGGHRLVDHPFHEAACHDCLRLGSVEYFRQGRDKGLHGCTARPESIDHLALTGAAVIRDRNGRAEESARLWFHEAAIVRGMDIGSWRPVLNHTSTCAHFTFRDRKYWLKYDLAGYGMVAEKLENRGQPAPKKINTAHADNYNQVAFHFYDLVNKYEAPYFATYTPGREDVILYAPEGQISAVLRLTGLTRPGDPLAEVTDAVCDVFGAITDLTFQNVTLGDPNAPHFGLIDPGEDEEFD